MKIDERALTAAIAAAADCGWMFEKPLHRGDMAAIIRAYLAALPHEPAGKGRDRRHSHSDVQYHANAAIGGDRAMTDHPYQPGTKWAPKSGRGKPRTIVEPRWPDARDGKGLPYVWWDEMMSGRMIECRRATVTQFERWAGERVG